MINLQDCRVTKNAFHEKKIMATDALIVEDHPLYRGALMHLVRHIVGNDNVAEASSAEEGLSIAGSVGHLGLILLDSGLPGLNGVEAVTAFRRKCPSAIIIVVSASEDRREANAALQAGAKAFISKAVSTEAIAKIVQRALAGELLEPEWITLSGDHAVGEEPLLMLTPRQREILVLLSQGLSNKEIGLRLKLAEITVKLHVSAIFRALNVVNRTQAVLVARRFGLHSPKE